jgi:hypothetical protein
MTTKANTVIAAIANKLVEFKWNCTSRTATICKIFRLLGKDWNDIANLKNFLQDEKNRMKEYDFNQYYGSEIISTLDELIAAVEKNKTNKTVFSTEILVGMRIRTALKENYLYREFNWDNYVTLEEHGMLDVMGDFDTYFRGKVEKVHKVHESRYVIVETSRHPFDYDKQRTKWKEPAETNFYAYTKNDKGVYRDMSTVYRTFEDALFSVICPTFSGAMSALLRESKRED